MFFSFFVAAVLSLGNMPSTHFVPKTNSIVVDEWQKLLDDSIEVSSTIQNSVERNKMLQFLQNMKQKTQEEAFNNVSENNYFYGEKQRLQWEELVGKLQSRLNSAQQNLPDGSDKALIVRILKELNRSAAKHIAPIPETVVKKVETWNPVEYVKNVYVDEWVDYNLAQVKKQLGNFSPSVFISYAWGPTEQLFVHQLADHLSAAGMNVRLDKWHNGLSTSIHTEFVNELESVDYIIVVGSKLYGDKCRQNKNNVVIAEARIIAERHKRQPGRILPILISENPREAFPAFLRDKVFANFINPKDYPQQLGIVILALSKYADQYSEIDQTLQNMVEGAEQIQKLSVEGLSKHSIGGN